jgi:hypothetical protein
VICDELVAVPPSLCCMCYQFVELPMKISRRLFLVLVVVLVIHINKINYIVIVIIMFCFGIVWLHAIHFTSTVLFK